MIWGKRVQRPVLGEGRPLGAVRRAVDGAAAGGWEALDRLVEVLLEAEAAGDEAAARSALAMVTGVAGLVTRLDAHARQGPWSGTFPEAAVRGVRVCFSGVTSGPAAMALASMDGDGRLRERAVAAMVARPWPEVMPFLVLRTADWVKPVRDRARAGLAVLLGDGPGAYLPAVLPMVLRLDARVRGGFAVTQVRAALLSSSPEVWRGLFGSGGRRQRRFVFDIAVSQGWLRLPDYVTSAETDPDVGIRVRAAEVACREAVWTRRLDVLRRLARSRRPEVRVVALTGLARVGHDSEVAVHLDDDAPLVRAVARDAARRLGIDAREHYRTAVSAAEPLLGAITGLAESGSAADAPLLRPLLRHPLVKVRAQAVRGLRVLDAPRCRGIGSAGARSVADGGPGSHRRAAAAGRCRAAGLTVGAARGWPGGVAPRRLPAAAWPWRRRRVARRPSAGTRPGSPPGRTWQSRRNPPRSRRRTNELAPQPTAAAVGHRAAAHRTGCVGGPGGDGAWRGHQPKARHLAGAYPPRRMIALSATYSPGQSTGLGRSLEHDSEGCRWMVGSATPSMRRSSRSRVLRSWSGS